MSALPDIHTRCLIVGGGPAGIMAGYLLARAGVQVTVLEKHADFFRDFRGDTIHPSTMDVLGELDLLEEFLKQPHQQKAQLSGIINGHEITIADFSHLPTRCKFIAFMPQWDFLNFLSGHAKKFPSFTLLMQHEATDLLIENNRVVGVRAKTSDGERNFRADLTIGADGRHAITHTKAGFALREFGAPIDVLWMRIPKHPTDPGQLFGFFRHGKLLVLLDRDEYFQAGLVIPKGGIDQLKSQGLDEVHRQIVAQAPFLADRIAELDTWDKIKLLTVQINRLKKWYRDGLLCIGDSAHAMSPAGGVGINLALQDAVAAANILCDKLKTSTAVTTADLKKVQKRRMWPTRVIQRMQIIVHKRVVTGRSSGNDEDSLPLVPWLLHSFPYLQRFPAKLVGIGPRPEHVQK